MREHIHSEWIDTDMGSGCKMTLKDTQGSVIYEHKYLDIFELPEEAPETESQEYYEEWKENFQEDSLKQFTALCEVKYLYFYI
jgi:hypothetical protein